MFKTILTFFGKRVTSGASRMIRSHACQSDVYQPRFSRSALLPIGLAIGVALSSAPVGACGPDTDCQIGDRDYRIALPDTVTPDTGALIYMHGYRGSSKGSMRNKALRRLANDLGVVLVAANASDDDWLIPGRPRHQDADGSVEYRYFEALTRDLVDRHGLNPEQFVATGFSAGGMVVWQLACNRSDLFRAFIPIAGTFWAPVPADCPGMATDLVHIHGSSDKIVPFRGRPIADSHQGDIFKAMDLARRKAGFAGPVKFEDGDLSCARETGTAGGMLIFCTHPGGHSLKMDFLRTALKQLSERGVFATSDGQG